MNANHCFPGVALLLLLALPGVICGQSQETLVFVLAGQSNMEGKGSILTLNRQLQDPEQAGRYQSLTRDGQFFVRDDVFISYLGSHGTRNGPLEIGYGTSKKNDRSVFGPELGFGWKLGDHCTANVLIIKTAWGGKSLDCDFRPPSRGLPASADEHFNRRQRKDPDVGREACNEDYGRYFRRMIEHIQQVMENPTEVMTEPGKLKLAGFVWFQGFNDQFAPTSVQDYEDNLVAFIKDVRIRLNAPDLPFVIGAMGHGGRSQEGKIKRIADAQISAAGQFSDGRITAIPTARFWDEEADQAFRKYWADEANRDIPTWQKYGNDRPYHYHGSPRFFWNVGQSFGDAMIALMEQPDR
jgi:alpha-galactosidase